MPNNQSQPSESMESPCSLVQENAPSGSDSSAPGGKDMQASRNFASVPQSKFRKIPAAENAFLDPMVEEEPPPPPEKPLKESVREFFECCRNREKRIAMLKEFGTGCRTLLLRGLVLLALFALTLWSTLRVLDYHENHRARFFLPDEVTDYLVTEHESLEAAVHRMTPAGGRDDRIPFDRFDAKLIETVRPVRIYSDEYGVYFMTSNGRYNGEHGIFIAKNGKNMPPDLNWERIEGHIYTYAIYD